MVTDDDPPEYVCSECDNEGYVEDEFDPRLNRRCPTCGGRSVAW